MSRFRLLAVYAATRARRFPSRSALDAWQEARVRAHLAWVLPRSAYTRERFGGRPAAQWRAVPAMAKAEMMAHFDRLVTVPVRRDDAFAIALRSEATRDFAPLMAGGIAAGLSSGTSGSRGLFLVSPAERDRWAGTVLARVLPGSLFAQHRVAFFLRANSALYERVGSRRIQFEFFDLLDAFEDHVARLNVFRPTVLVAPPSMLRMLAGALEDGRLRIAPERIIAVAEVLDDLDRAYVEARFGTGLHAVYQATEGFIGFTCARGTMHLNETDVVVEREPVAGDASGRRFTPVVTDFRRRAQPVIRYRLDDVLVLRADPCPCGSVLTALERVEGRADDVFLFARPDGGLVPVFPDFIRRAVLVGAPEARAYVATQTAPERVEIALTVDDAHREASEAGVRSELGALAGRLGAIAPAVVFVPPPPEHAGAVKLRRVVQAFAGPAAGARPANG